MTLKSLIVYFGRKLVERSDFCAFFEKFSKSRKMASLEEKSDKFTRRKIQGFVSMNFAECLKMLQKFKIRENGQFRREKLSIYLRKRRPKARS